MKVKILVGFLISVLICKLFSSGQSDLIFNDANFKGYITELSGNTRYKGKFNYRENGIIEIRDNDNSIFSTYYCEKYNTNIKSEVKNNDFIWLLYSASDYKFNENTLIITAKNSSDSVKLIFDPETKRLIELHKYANKKSEIQILRYKYTMEGSLNSINEIIDNTEIVRSEYFYDGIYRDNLQRPYIIEIPGRNYPYTVFRPISSIYIFDDKKRGKYTLSISRLNGDRDTSTLKDNEVIYYKRIIEYDEFGNVIRFSNDYTGTIMANDKSLQNYIIDYEFDENGNWTKAEVFELLENNERKSIHIGKREISY